MDLKVGGVLELLRHPRAIGFGDNLLGALDCAFHALFPRGQIEGRAKSEH
jgi:hypothetical protein